MKTAMNKLTVLSHKFVEFIPEKMEEGTLYISIDFATAAHKCGCGCGNEVITPLSPTDWKMIFNGKSISLYPSIGNWSFPCRSHYWIENNRIIWSWKWTQEEIDEGRAYDSFVKKKYYHHGGKQNKQGLKLDDQGHEEVHLRESFWQMIKNLLF
jgi:hypothetical protein